MNKPNNSPHLPRFSRKLIGFFSILPAVIYIVLFITLAGASADAPTPYLAADINTTPMVGSEPRYLTAVGETLFFVADDGNLGFELWKTDSSGTSLVKDITPGSDPLSPYNLGAFNNALFFTGDDGINGEELWTSDGTITGTVLFKDINPTGNSRPTRLTVVGDTLFFQASDGVHGYELWKSDGTITGTLMVKDINPNEAGSSPTILTNVNGTLFFVAIDPEYGEELWKSDGTPGGTMMVKDIKPGAAYSDIRRLANVNGLLFFRADDGVHGLELWKSDGTETGTVLVKDILPGEVGSNPDIKTFGDKVLLSANDGINGTELWVSDGSEAGTFMVKDIEVGPVSSNPSAFYVVENTLYFSAYQTGIGRELFKSEGTASSTQLVKDINASGASTPLELFNIDNTLLFRADDGVHGVEFWKSNGSDADTLMVMDINPDENSAQPGNFVRVLDKMYFTADDGEHGVELWALSLENQPPTASAGGPYEGDEGTEITLAGTAFDDHLFTVNWSVDDPLCTFIDPHALDTTIVCADNVTTTVNLEVQDWWGVIAMDQTMVTTSNLPPEILTISFSSNPAFPYSPVTATIIFDDPGTADIHVGDIDWGDGLSESLDVDQDFNTATAAHVYTSTGEYTVEVRIEDDEGAYTTSASLIVIGQGKIFLPVIAR